MVQAVDQLLSMWQQDDPWSYDARALADVQLQALQERFVTRRDQLPVLEQRAAEQGVERIDHLDAMVPLLFSHAIYKSYPASFVDGGEWDSMTRWLGTLSTRSLDALDLRGVNTVSDWVHALHAAGHCVVTSSGTGGKESFLDHTASDREHIGLAMQKGLLLSIGLHPEPVHPVFAGYPRAGRRMGEEVVRLLCEIYGKPGDIHFLTDEYVAIGELIDLANTRRAALDAEETGDASARQVELEQAIDRWVEQVLERRHEPMILAGPPAMVWRVIEGGRARGVPDGDFHPGLVVRSGGGFKGFVPPGDFRTLVCEFFGMDRSRLGSGYGTSELPTPFHGCAAGACHAAATTVVLLLDKRGERLLNRPSGIVEGRGAFFDVALEGRWGGLIAGDRMKVNFDPCSCGRKSPSLLDIARYKDLPEGDDELAYPGEIEARVRELMTAR